MAIQRHFLGWDRPLLAASVDWLAEHYPLDSSLADVGIVVPARRAGRRLLELLAERAASCQPPMALVPPTIITPSQWPERLYQPNSPTADELTCLLARCQALRSFEAGALKRLIPEPPSASDLGSWLALAEDLAALDDELSAQGLSLSDVPGKLGETIDFTHEDRWDFLAQAQQRYEAFLAQAGWSDRNRQRKQAIECGGAGEGKGGGGRFRSDKSWVILGVLDLSPQLRQMLSMLDAPVASLVFAPQDQAERFDDFGSIRPEAWEQAIIPLADDQWRLASRPSDQADTVLTELHHARSREPRLAPDQVTIGLCDETMGPMLARCLEVAGVPARLAIGDRLSASDPATFLRALAAFVSSQRWDDFSALVRHSDVEDWVHRQVGERLAEQGIADWHTLLDKYLNDHIQGRISQNWLGRPERARPLAEVHQSVWSLLPEGHAAVRPLSDWAAALAGMLQTFYGDRIWHRQNPADGTTVQAIQAIGQQLQAIAAMSGDSPLTPKVTFVQAIAVVLNRLSSLSATPVSRSGHEGEGLGGAGGGIEGDIGGEIGGGGKWNCWAGWNWRWTTRRC